MNVEFDDIFEDEIISIEIILNYLSRLLEMPKKGHFNEYGREKIVESIDYYVSDSDQDLCELVDKLILTLKDPELCYEMASNIYWVDVSKYGQVVIDSKDLQNNYYFASNIDGCDMKGHCDVLLKSDEKDYYVEKAKDELQYHLYPYLGIEKDKVKEKNKKN